MSRLPKNPIRRIALVACVGVLAIGISACAGSGEEEETGVQLPDGCESVSAPAPKTVDLKAPDTPLTTPTNAIVETSCGSFTIALDVKEAPTTSSSFAFLAREGVYDNTLIHRIEPGFVIQGGDPNGDGSGGPGYSVEEPPPADIEYRSGVAAMAKTGAEPAGTSGSQFFIVTADSQLPPDYALLGQVVSGMDVVMRIEELGAPGGQPLAPVVIEKVTIEPA